ncbi:NAD(P)-dependent oxidoreductase [Streptomyces sp. NPDC054796]
MRITVFGATGGTGVQLVLQALDAGHEVTAVVRDPGRLAVSHERLEVITADVTDAESLVPALEGREAALSGLGSPHNKGAGIASEGTRAILRALEQAGVSRYIAVSAAPVGPAPEGEGPLYRKVMLPLVRRAFRDVYADLAVMEEEIFASAAEWTVVRPPRLTDAPRTERYRRTLGGAVSGGHHIPRSDLAHAMLAMLGDAATVKQVVGVAI